MKHLYGKGTRYDLSFKYCPELHSEFRDAKIIDVGCGAISNDWNSNFPGYIGLDIPGSYKKIDGFLRAENFIPYSFNDGDLPEELNCDVVLCLDVMEHIENPWKLLASFQNLADKMIVISLPNNWFRMAKQIKTGRATYKGYGLPVNGFLPGLRHKYFFNTEEAIAFIIGNLSESWNVEVVVDYRSGMSGPLYEIPLLGKLLTLIVLPKKVTYVKRFGGLGSLLHSLASSLSVVIDGIHLVYKFLRFPLDRDSMRYANMYASGVWFVIRKCSPPLK